MSGRTSRRFGSIGARLAFTVWFVSSVFATTNVARETYLALAIAEGDGIRVDKYLGLHSDLFEIPGRGGYINNNPGASFLGALPYLVARPVLEAVYRWKPGLVAPRPPAAYDDPRPNRTKFMNAARERGLDVKLGIAALVTAVGLMAPLGALGAWLVFGFLRNRGVGERAAAGWGALYALGTPIFFRSAFLNQNALLTHAVLGAFILLAGWRPRPTGAPVPARDLVGIGLLLGYGLVCDYSAAPLLLMFGAWILGVHASRGVAASVRAGALYTAGALPMMALLLAYQAAAFGSPWFPAQRYMPATEYSVIGWNGFFVPTQELLLGNLLDPRYGLFAFCPLLAAALAAPFVRRDATDVDRPTAWWILATSTALYVFSSANQFANLQWNTGVRYLVPAVPILFLAARPVLRATPGALRGILIAVSVVISLAVSMTRESVGDALALVFSNGPTLPVFVVLQKMAAAYPALQFGALGPLVALGGTTVLLWILWRGELRGGVPA